MDTVKYFAEAIKYYNIAANTQKFSPLDIRNTYSLKAAIKLCRLTSDADLIKVNAASLPFFRAACAEHLPAASLGLGNYLLNLYHKAVQDEQLAATTNAITSTANTGSMLDWSLAQITSYSRKHGKKHKSGNQAQSNPQLQKAEDKLNKLAQDYLDQAVAAYKLALKDPEDTSNVEVLYNLGQIYLYTSAYFDPKKALKYLTIA